MHRFLIISTLSSDLGVDYDRKTWKFLSISLNSLSLSPFSLFYLSLFFLSLSLFRCLWRVVRNCGIPWRPKARKLASGKVRPTFKSIAKLADPTSCARSHQLRSFVPSFLHSFVRSFSRVKVKVCETKLVGT